ncbi:Las1-like-domain-containing protein [Phlyctochytrium arcticum]|nr:Las1-like-domain-containing protein [Phlyctochytrium arcticum]
MAPRRLPRYIPWAKQEEWDAIYACLYAADTPESINMRYKGVKMAKAWASRGKLPLSVDTTAKLVEIWLRDGCGGRYGPPTLSEHEMRLLYCMVFIRFVNGVVDANQKGMYATSMTDIADKVDLPRWLVDLRHSAAHGGNLPELSLLRAACVQSLDWLQSNYWDIQKTYLADTTTELRKLIQEYKQAHARKAINDARTPANETANIINEIVTLTTSDNYVELLIPILLEEGALVPMEYRDRVIAPNFAVPQSQDDMWKPVLFAFERAWPGFLEELVISIIQDLPLVGPLEDDSPQRTLAAWVRHLVVQHFLRASSGWDNILEVCLRKRNLFTHAFVSEFATARLELQDRLHPFLEYLNSSSTTSEIKENHLDDEEFISRRLLEMRSRIDSFARLPQAESSTMPAGDENGAVTAHTMGEEVKETCAAWSLYPEEEWRPCPIGTMPGGALPDMDLPERYDDPIWAEQSGLLQVPMQVIQGPIT